MQKEIAVIVLTVVVAIAWIGGKITIKVTESIKRFEFAAIALAGCMLTIIGITAIIVKILKHIFI